MGKPRLIILIRHAQSEGNKNREIHQNTPDHRVPLTTEGQQQALDAGRQLRTLLRPDDTLHFFTSPYRRTRETTEGILTSLTSNDPSPSAFPRHTIKVYEEPRLREQDFGNFQPGAEAMHAMWQQRADYGHFFFRIPNGESAADAYDRVSGFNDSLWRRFDDKDCASVFVLVTHGLMSRVFLMKWYHWSVEYFEDLRNVNHCEFIVMKKNPESGRYVLQNQLRTWSELKRERLSRGSFSPSVAPSVPTRRRWTSCSDSGESLRHGHSPRKPPQRQDTAELFSEVNELVSEAPSRRSDTGSPRAQREDRESEGLWQTLSETDTGEWRSRTRYAPALLSTVEGGADITDRSGVESSVDLTTFSGQQTPRPNLITFGGRDGGGTKSGGAPIHAGSEDEDPDASAPRAPPPTRDQLDKKYPDSVSLDPHLETAVKPQSLARALQGEFSESDPNRAMADALGDQSDASVDETDAEMGDKEREREEMQKIVESERRDRSLRGSI